MKKLLYRLLLFIIYELYVEQENEYQRVQMLSEIIPQIPFPISYIVLLVLIYEEYKHVSQNG